jgi:hypothetical protein
VKGELFPVRRGKPENEDGTGELLKRAKKLAGGRAGGQTNKASRAGRPRRGRSGRGEEQRIGGGCAGGVGVAMVIISNGARRG